MDAARQAASPNTKVRVVYGALAIVCAVRNSGREVDSPVSAALVRYARNASAVAHTSLWVGHHEVVHSVDRRAQRLSSDAYTLAGSEMNAFARVVRWGSESVATSAGRCHCDSTNLWSSIITAVRVIERAARILHLSTPRFL